MGILESDRRTASLEQRRAWSYYGSPFIKAGKDNPGASAVGEVRYVVGWAADQMSRMRWSVLVDGSPEWTLEMPDGTRVRSTPDTNTSEAEAHASASRTVLGAIHWNDSIVRQVTTNLYVAGELDYVAKASGDWEVVSVIHPDRKELLKEAAHSIRGLWPHPADPNEPDAPLFGVLSVLEEMDWLNRLSRSQSANRVGMRGIVGSADGLNFAGGGDFWEEWDRALRAKMNDPTDEGPLHLRGAAELVEPSGNGMRGLSWLVPDFPYDQRIDSRMQSLIQRLAYGLPIPPEILLGLQAQSRATAFQVEENSYRAHIEPPAQVVARVATQALSVLIDRDIEVIPDPSLLLARRHTTEDVKQAFDRGAVSFRYLREVLGIPEEAAPTVEDLQLFLLITNPGAVDEDPATVAARSGRSGSGDTGVTASAQSSATAVSEIAGATAIAATRARERVGAKARTYAHLRETLNGDVPNDKVASVLGSHTLEGTGVRVQEIITDSLAPLESWWLSKTDNRMSADLLVDLAAEHVYETLEDDVASPLSEDACNQIANSLL